MKIKDLPFGVIWQLCMYLDRIDQPQQNWKAVLASVSGSPYTALQVAAFERVGCRPNGSPAEAMIQDFITRGFTVDELFSMLRIIGHLEGMRTLKDHVSPHLQRELLQMENGRSEDGRREAERREEEGRRREQDAQRETRGQSPPAPPPSASPPLEIHPEWGPLPPVPLIARGPYFDTRHKKPGEGLTPTWEDGIQGSKVNLQQSSTAVVGNQTAGGVRVWEGGAQNGITTAQGVRYGQEGTYQPATPKGFPHGYPGSPQQPPVISSPGEMYLPTAPPRPGAMLVSPDAPRPLQIAPTIHGVVLPPSMTNQPPVALPAPSNYEAVHVPTREPSLHIHKHSPVQPQPQPCLPEVLAPPTSPPPSLNILTFNYEELSEATGNFTQNMIGIGSFGTVFRAKIRGSGPYAIKKLHSESEMEGGVFYETCFHQETFKQELQMLTKYHHRNILSLVAYSNDGPRPCLVYEYMENGSLQDCLLGEKQNVMLPWSLRLEIANQIADALHFLHTVNKTQHLVHGDVKSANILLDSHYVPKLSDFGLARECQVKPGTRSTLSTGSSVVMGTLAYMAPEFLRNKKLTPTTDVYSFGVVLLELYTGEAADNPSLQQRTLTERLIHLLEETDEGTPEHDQRVNEVLTHADPQALWPRDTGFDLFEIATVCLRGKAKARPPMDQVRTQLDHLSTESAMGYMRLTEPAAVPAYHSHSAGETPPIASPYMVNTDWTYNTQH